MAIAREQLDRVGRHQWIRESLNQRGYWTTKSLSSQQFIILFWHLIDSPCKAEWGGVRWRFWKIMIDWPSVRVEKLICIGRASLARCSAAKIKRPHTVFCFLLLCIVLYMERNTYIHIRGSNLFMIRRHVYSYADRDTGTYILYSTLQYDDEHRIYLFFSFLILFFSFRFNQKENLISLSLSLSSRQTREYIHILTAE